MDATSSTSFGAARRSFSALADGLRAISRSHSPTRACASFGAESRGAFLIAAARPLAGRAIFLAARFAGSVVTLDVPHVCDRIDQDAGTHQCAGSAITTRKPGV